VPNKYLDAGLYIARFGFSAYNETLLSLNCYKRLSDYISLGIRISYFSLHYTAKESNAGAVTGDIGITIRPMEHFLMSVVADKSKFGRKTRKSPRGAIGRYELRVSRKFLVDSRGGERFRVPGRV
ncbi:MAG: hypothetical protein RR371_07360, partial [Bacteroides sp.]